MKTLPRAATGYAACQQLAIMKKRMLVVLDYLINSSDVGGSKVNECEKE